MRFRAWIKVDESLIRWVQYEKARAKEIEFFDIQYENLPYFGFSCSLLGHAKLLCLTLRGRDEFGRSPYRESLAFMSIRNTSLLNLAGLVTTKKDTSCDDMHLS